MHVAQVGLGRDAGGVVRVRVVRGAWAGGVAGEECRVGGNRTIDHLQVVVHLHLSIVIPIIGHIAL